ncbi:N-terminal 7TM region of histidine kinase [Treponema bryantii]|uniref:N-terminal 7TM region of histidine kinase n=1 Tax=Treponema bryantii TaxID=163 RepID=A0A1I3MVU3_9SPIR|nr:HD domain-containing phosphohydrolase [Treponema bryantii]SFJ01081.1 N-terminal 7TM region of histidine kinase [Treponema bryantii]
MNLRIIYLIALFISLVALYLYYEINSNNLNKNYLTLFLTTFVSNFGYAMSVHADTLEGALSGNLLSYIGSIFTLLFGLIVILDMCHKKFYFVFRFGLLIFATVLSILLATTKETQLFFAHPYIVTEMGLTLIKFKMGPAMIFYMCFIAGINIAAITSVIHSIFTKNNVSKKSLQILLCMLIFGTLAYIIPLVIGTRINLMPYIYIFMESFFLYFSAKTNTYDLQLNLLNVYKNRTGYGYIAFDNKKRFLGCDDFALTFFPKLSEISLDSYIPKTFTNIIDNLHYDDWNWNEHCNEDFRIQYSDKAGICTIHRISASKMKMGFFLELRDDTEQQNYIKGLNSFNKELSHLVKEKTEQVTDMQDSIIRGIATMVESRDNSTGGHILRTSDCIQIFAEELLKHKEIEKLSPAFLQLLVKAAPMHDLGKIAVDDSILRKPGKFTPEEYEKMKEHPAKGAIIVKKVLSGINDEEFRQIAVNVAHYHHEKWDGTGYPEKLSGEAIPLEARIMALADVFDALVSKRCYKEAQSFNQAFEIIKNDLGKHFDPVIGKIFIECRPQLEEYYKSSVQDL